MYHGFNGLCINFLAANLISPIHINRSAIKSVFSCLKYISGGHLSSTNYCSSLLALVTQREVATNASAKKGYRTDINIY